MVVLSGDPPFWAEGWWLLVHGAGAGPGQGLALGSLGGVEDLFPPHRIQSSGGFVFSLLGCALAALALGIYSSLEGQISVFTLFDLQHFAARQG